MTLMTEDAELERIVSDVQSGDERAFAQLVAHVRNRVRTWASRLTGDEDEAEDIAQDVVIGLGRQVHQYRGESRFTTWLYTITRNATLARGRTQSRRLKLVQEQGMRETVSPRAPGHGVDQHRVSTLVLECFAALPSRQKLVFERIDLRGESVDDVALELRLPSATIRMHLYRARRTIRTRMLTLHEPLVREYFE